MTSDVFDGDRIRGMYPQNVIDGGILERSNMLILARLLTDAEQDFKLDRWWQFDPVRM